MPDLSVAAASAAGTTWCAAWSQPHPSAWTALYTADATYTDHAFGFIRRGHAGLAEHFALWRSANPDFRATVTQAFPGLDLGGGLVKYSLRTRNEGTFRADLPTLRASGRDFRFDAMVDLVVREGDGLIVGVVEFYHRQFDRWDFVERDAPKL
ncbi:hypothetical protein LTR53_000050 [Teratosphaeriaceae sp. CCFEE 6253]|nr:hypothetical protein LTR53_000050 [Teratosphaeriaceae sp. CCFEE 6253]